MSTSVIAEIQSIQGTAYAVAVDGTKRLLQLGDQLFEGEVLETSEGGAVQLLLTDGSSYEVAGIPQLLLSAELLAGADSSRDENEVAATTFDALVEEGFGDTLEEAVAQSDTVIDQALEDIFSEELEATAAGTRVGVQATVEQGLHLCRPFVWIRARQMTRWTALVSLTSPRTYSNRERRKKRRILRRRSLPTMLSTCWKTLHRRAVWPKATRCSVARCIESLAVQPTVH